ncbi:COX15/CtaA family protein [Pelagibacteraceae bacterium]|nr:COX15/CtaA family protein [Pelagibacteraceae bacterium]
MLILNNNKKETFFQYWLISLIFLICLMIVVGGLTRLTDSGLSITEWDLFTGVFPPLNNTEWLMYFDLYKQIPQFYLLNSNMTLEEFKTIFLWEYYHRLLGRLIGLVFLIPLIYFIYKKILTKKYIFILISVFFLVLLQGFIGWYMVKSGLVNNVTVSHYRLSTHLFLAFTILSSLIWVYMNYRSNKNKVFFSLNGDVPLLKTFIFFLYLQIIIGAFVSGLDAGKIYQTWPLMNNSYFPDDINKTTFNFLINFKSQSYVQFLHRNIAYLIFIIYLIVGFFIFLRNKKNMINTYLFLLLIVISQILLGILTLKTGLNIYIASTHQISSIFLIIFSLRLYHQSIE